MTPGGVSVALLAPFSLVRRLMPDYTGVDPQSAALDETKGARAWLGRRAADLFTHPKDSAQTTATRSFADRWAGWSGVGRVEWGWAGRGMALWRTAAVLAVVQ